MAVEVMGVLSNLAATGLTVLCSIHGPSSEAFQHVDRLALLKVW